MRNRKRVGQVGAVMLGATLLLTSSSVATADTPYTATGWLSAVPAPGLWCTNGSGQIGLRGNAHEARVECLTDERLTGRRLIFVNGAVQADGSSLLYGTCYQEVGTWDATGTNFTATGGLWEINYRGVMQADNSLQLHLVGNGTGGTIDGMRFDETLTREPCNGPLDPAMPYLYTGTLKPAPVDTTQMLDDFSLPFTGSTWGRGACSSSGGQFYAVGNFPIVTASVFDSYVFGGRSVGSGSVPDGQTREWRADLVSLSDNATNTAILAVGSDTGAGYAVHKGRDFIYLLKWSSTFGISILWCERPTLPLPNTNVIVAVALTRRQSNLIVTARVLEKSNPATVLFQHSVVDTPTSDPTLNTARFQALTGIRFADLVAERAESPPASVFPVLGVFQNTDGHQPVPTAIWDNLEVRTSEVPSIELQPAVVLTWPNVGSYAVEGAPTVNGPWLPVQSSVPPGCQQMIVPQSGPMQFFRAVQAPRE